MDNVEKFKISKKVEKSQTDEKMGYKISLSFLNIQLRCPGGHTLSTNGVKPLFFAIHHLTCHVETRPKVEESRKTKKNLEKAEQSRKVEKSRKKWKNLEKAEKSRKKGKNPEGVEKSQKS